MRVSGAVALLVSLLVAASANAVIVNIACQDDGDGAVTMQAPVCDGIGSMFGTIDVKELQHSSPAHLLGDVTSDTETDPTVRITKDVTNDTGFAWSGYIFNIMMNKTFTIDAAVAPTDWSVQAITQPTLVGAEYVGQVVFDSNGPAFDILNGGEGIFKATVSFLGSVQFCVEQVPVPEPVTLALLAIGGLFVARRR